ncbi:hypothetical protein JW977_01585 [Candidatus Falkowbacteria bacterium]|nr:hypothetical protein [Candidatus Falkowbacteria bacterium]
MKKIYTTILISLVIGLFLFLPQANAVSSLNNVRLDIQPRTLGALSSWTVSFEMPQTAKVGFVEISLGGSLPSLASSTVTVSGLSGGRVVVGKTNPNCVSNCDDIKYFFNTLTEIKANTKIVFTVNSVRNPISGDKSGLSFINLFSSLSPQRDLLYASTNIFLPLMQEPTEEELIPPSATSEAPTSEGIYGIVLNDLFYQQGAKTTRLSAIKDPAKVQNFTLDLLGKEMVTFKGTINLSDKNSIKFVTNLSEHMTFEHLNFIIDENLMKHFGVPLEITYYDVPFVYNPDVYKDEEITLTKDQLTNYKFYIIDNKTQVSFIIKEAGAYKLIPHFEVYITDNQVIKTDTNLATFSGRISDPKALINVKLNSNEVKGAVSGVEPATGSFSFAVNLSEGTNIIEIAATSEFGKIEEIKKIVQFYSTLKQPTQEKEGISPINIAAVILAVVAILLIWALHSTRKRKRYSK